MTKKLKSFQLRPVEEQALLCSVTWCDQCQQADLGMVEPLEYEEAGKLYLAGSCSVCGGDVLSEIEVRYPNRD